MSELQGVVGRLAAAIADGEPVEWSSVDGLATSPKDRALIRQLRTIAAFEKRGGSGREPIALGTDVAWPSGPWLAVLMVAGAEVLGAVGTIYFLNELNLTLAGQHQLANLLAISLSFATAAFLLVGGGRRDSRARHLGHAYLLTAAAFAQPLVEMLATRGVLPIANLLRGIYPEAFLPVAVWRFAGSFPRVRRFTRFDRSSAALTTASLLIGTFLFVDSFVLFHWPDIRWRAPSLWILRRSATDPSLGFWLPIFCLMLAAIVVSLWRVSLSERDERLRAMWFLSGLAVGVLPLFTLALLRSVSVDFRIASTTGSLQPFAYAVVLTAIISVPFTTAYSVLVHRVLNVRLVLHRTLRYVLAKYTLSGLIAVPLVIPLRLAYLHRDWRIDDVLADPRTVTAGWLMLTGTILLALRGRLIAVVDRVFLGKHLEHSSTLAGATTAIGRGRTPREVAFEAANRLTQALGVSHVTIMLRTSTGDFHAIHGAAPDVPKETALLAILGEIPAVVLSRDSQLFELLPARDREWLTRCDFEVVARVPSADRDVAGIVGIGSRGKGVPFSKSDLSFIGAVIATAGLALSRPWSDEDSDQGAVGGELGAVECERCGAVGEAPSCACIGSHRPARLPLLLSNKFAILRRLGHGGMGVVYLGRDVRLDRKVALKTLPEVSRDAASAMLVEARTMAQVEHPNVALIYSLETWRNTPVLVVEYLGGGTLADRLDDGPLPVRDALTMGAALADGLAALHASGILHRDIKPSNIGFTRSGAPKLLDFGVARLLAHASAGVARRALPNIGVRPLSNTAVAGTPLYLSPEALNGAPPDFGTDLWSTAVVLLQSITGEYPFSGRSRADALERVAAGVPDWQRARRRLASPIVDLFERAFSRDISRRPQTAGEFAAALRTLIPHFS